MSANFATFAPLIVIDESAHKEHSVLHSINWFRLRCVARSKFK